MISIDGKRVRLSGKHSELVTEFACLFHVMDKKMPDVLSDALDLIENAKDDDFRMFEFSKGTRLNDTNDE